MISTIALDLDGTLLDPEGTVSPANRRALERASEQGISIVLCTGRHDFDVSWIARELDSIQYIASSNGAYMTDGSGNLVYSKPMSDREVASVAGAVRSAGLSAVWYAHNRIIVDSDCPFLPWYRKRDDAIGNVLRLSVQDDSLASIRSEHDTIYKIAVSGYGPGQFGRFEEELAAHGISWTTSASHNREIMADGVSKAVALTEALRGLNAGREELVAVGDGLNDVELIRFAGVGVAMGNACGELKAIADAVCPSNEDDGIAHVIDLILEDRIDDLLAQPILG